MRNILPALAFGTLTGLAHADTPETDGQATASSPAVLSLVASFRLEYEQWNQYNLGLTAGAPWSPRPILGGGVAGSRGPVGVDLTGDFVFSQERIGLRDLTGLLRYEHGKWFVYGGTAWSNEPAAPDSPVDGIFRSKLGVGVAVKNLNGLGALNLTVTATCALDRPWEYMGPDCLGARVGVEWRRDVVELDTKKERIPSSPMPSDASMDLAPSKPWYEDLSSEKFGVHDSVEITAEMAGEVQRLCAEVQKPNKTPQARDDDYSALRAKVGPMHISSRCHYVAAEAAFQLGDLYSAYERYSHVTDFSEIAAVLEEIRQNYRLVELVFPKKIRTVRVWDESFNEYVMPFPPSPRRAVEFAETSSNLKGRFSGILPRGQYRVEYEDGTFAYFDVTEDEGKQKPELRATK